nr:hypothetical protein [uncultured Sphaerochaeta sp.]
MKKKIGSANKANVASREAPIPSNELPISMAARIWKNLARPNIYANKIISPLKLISGFQNPIGSIAAAVIIVTRFIIGSYPADK